MAEGRRSLAMKQSEENKDEKTYEGKKCSDYAKDHRDPFTGNNCCSHEQNKEECKREFYRKYVFYQRYLHCKVVFVYVRVYTRVKAIVRKGFTNQIFYAQNSNSKLIWKEHVLQTSC